jgi:hypothetical protein
MYSGKGIQACFEYPGAKTQSGEIPGLHHPDSSDNDRTLFLYDLDIDGLVLVGDLVLAELACIDQALDMQQVGAQHPPEVVIHVYNLCHRLPSLLVQNPVNYECIRIISIIFGAIARIAAANGWCSEPEKNLPCYSI